MRRAVIGLTTAAGVLLSLSLGVVGPSATAQGHKPQRSGVSKASNRRAAVRDAGERLAMLELPPGALRRSERPSGSGSELKSPPSEPSTPNLIDLHAWWVLPDQPLEALDWIKAHLPPGSTLGIEGSESKFGRTTSWDIGLEWPPIKGRVDERALLITVTARSGGGTALRADAQAVWVTPHPASERIPAAARILEVKREKPGRRPRTATIAKPRVVREVAALIDGLPVVQPGTYSCPAELSNPPTVRLTFRARRNGRALAEAVQTLPPGPCEAMKLTIRGTPQTALEEGNVVLRELRRTLGGAGW